MRLKGFLRSSVVVAAFLASSAVALAYSGYTTGNVNMRTGPGTGYARITTLPAGAAINVVYCDGSWCHVRVGRLQGWVSASYVSGRSYRPPVVILPPIFDFPPFDRPPHKPPPHKPPPHKPPPHKPPPHKPPPNKPPPKDCKIAPGFPCP